jgi:hypothetical protein
MLESTNRYFHRRRARERMKTIRVLLFIMALLLVFIDVRAVDFLLHGPDVLHVIADGDALRVLPYRLSIQKVAERLSLKL